jgi:hypothetical protein
MPHAVFGARLDLVTFEFHQPRNWRAYQKDCVDVGQRAAQAVVIYEIGNHAGGSGRGLLRIFLAAIHRLKRLVCLSHFFEDGTAYHTRCTSNQNHGISPFAGMVASRSMS